MEIRHNLDIDDREMRFTFDRSAGPGGQNVNKVATRATLWFDVASSESLTSAQKARIRAALAHRLTRDGVLHIVCGRHRTQSANRRECLQRFVGLLRDALRPTKARKATRPTRASRERRLGEKARRSGQKRLREKRIPRDD